MIQGFKGVKYGLQVPAIKKKSAPVAKPGKLAAFGDDDNSDGEHEAVPQQLARQAASKKSNNKVAELHAAALAEDASVFDYDGVYDSMQEAKTAPLAAKRQNRGSKYIEGLLDKAEERKREQDIIFERRQVKERQAEDHLFGDKEKFVTAAYKTKLQEQQLWEAQQKLKDERDEANAGQKVGDMSGFYGNLMTKNVAFGASGAKKAADKEAQRDEAAVAAAAAAAGVTVPPGGGSPATATSPAADRDGSGGGSPRASAPAAERSPAAVAQRARSGDPTGQTGREAGGQAASAAAAAAGEAEAGEEREGGQAEAVVAPPRPTAVKHTDAAAKEAARERYLARKKRKAAGEPDA